MINRKLRKFEENLPIFGYSRTKNCVSDLFRDHICFMYTLKKWNHYWKNYMKEFMVVIQEEGFYHIGLSLKVIGG